MSALQQAAVEYWANCTTTYLASPEYYARQEAELRKLLAQLPRIRNAVDIGCGDGRYTRLLKEYADRALGVDLSEHLISQARASATHNRCSQSLQFEIGTVESFETAEVYDLVCCLGVMSALIDADAFEAGTRNLVRALAPDGRLLVKDTLSLVETRISHVDSYVAIYRNRDEYLSQFGMLGLELIKTVDLLKLPDSVNQLMLFKSTSAV